MSKSSDPERLNDICVAYVSDQDFISPGIECNFIFINMPHRIHNCTTNLYDYATIN